MKRLVWYLIFMLTFMYFLSSAQEIFMKKQYMHKIRVDVLQSFEWGLFCTHDTTIIFGTDHNDTTRFLINGKAYVFYPVHNDTWRNKRRQRQHIQNYVGKQNLVGDKLYVRQDDRNEKYILRFVYNDSGLIIFITNIDFGTPAFTLCFGTKCHLCSGNN